MLLGDHGAEGITTLYHAGQTTVPSDYRETHSDTDLDLLPYGFDAFNDPFGIYGHGTPGDMAPYDPFFDSVLPLNDMSTLRFSDFTIPTIGSPDTMEDASMPHDQTPQHRQHSVFPFRSSEQTCSASSKAQSGFVSQPLPDRPRIADMTALLTEPIPARQCDGSPSTGSQHHVPADGTIPPEPTVNERPSFFTSAGYPSNNTKQSPRLLASPGPSLFALSSSTPGSSSSSSPQAQTLSGYQCGRCTKPFVGAGARGKLRWVCQSLR